MKKINLTAICLAIFLFIALMASCKKANPTQPQSEATATMIVTATVTATASVVQSPTITSTVTFSPTITQTATITETSTITMTPTNTPEPPASTCSFGVNSTGDYYGGAGGVTIRLSRFNTAAGVTLTKIAYFVQSESEWTSGYHTAAIYSNSASNDPENLVVSTTWTAMAGLGWNTVDIAPTMLPAGDYWLGVSLSVANINYNITWNSETLGGVYSGTAWSDPWNGGTSAGGGYSIRGICE